VISDASTAALIGHPDRGSLFLLDRYLVLTIVVAERNHYLEEELMGRFDYWMKVSLDLRIEQVPC